MCTQMMSLWAGVTSEILSSQGSSGCLSTWGRGAAVPTVNPLVPGGRIRVLGEGPGRQEREIFGGLGTGPVYQLVRKCFSILTTRVTVSATCYLSTLFAEREGGKGKAAGPLGELVSSHFHYQKNSFHSEWVAGHCSHLAQRPKAPGLPPEGPPPPPALGYSEGRLPPRSSFPHSILAHLP